MKNLSKRNKIIIAVVGLILVIAMGIGVYFVIDNNKIIEAKHNDIYTIEYGTDFDLEQVKYCYRDYDNNISELEIDTFKMGGYGYPFKVKNTDMTLNVIVEDTIMPVIEGELEYETMQFTKVDYKQLTANDLIDGSLNVSYEGDVDFDIAGNYEVIAKAKDINGNETTAIIKITVIEKEKEIIEEDVETPPTTNPGNTTNNNTNSNSNNIANKPFTGNTTGNTGGSIQKPTETPKPVEPETPKRPGPQSGGGLIYYKDYGTHNACRAVSVDVLMENVESWRSNFCDDWGYMYYTPRN